MGLVLVQTEYFKNRIIYISASYVLTMRVIIYFINTLDSLGNYIFINIYYSPISRNAKGRDISSQNAS